MKIEVKKYLFFAEPEKNEKFILTELPNEADRSNGASSVRGADSHDQATNDYGSKNSMEPPPVSTNINNNLKYMKRRYNVPVNSDIVIREFNITIRSMPVRAFMIFIDGMIDKNTVSTDILEPLMLLSNINIKDNNMDASTFIKSRLIPNNQLKEIDKFSDIIGQINMGSCAIFIDGLSSAFVADVKGFEHRSIERPNTEQNIRGPQEGFVEVLRINTSMIRRRLLDEDLVIEDIKIGERSKTPCSMLYIKDIANDSLVAEVRRRMKGVKIDYLHSTGQLEQLIEDNSFSPSPQIVATERPDKVATMLTQGRVAVMVNGGTFALVMPVTIEEFLKAAEDEYIRFPYATLLRFIRIFGMLSALLFPGLYLAVTNYHQEMIPTSLLLAIQSSRERVPFPSIVEILIMEISFELIREAGIRIPGIIGPTIGIIGALILGQAAVAANIVSPILIVIVSVTGLGSFAIPDYAFSYSIRFLRFYYIFLGFIAGFLGIITGVFLQGLWLSSQKSFGVPILSPIGPRTNDKKTHEFIKPPVWMEKNRPDYLNPKDITKAPEISRTWDNEG